MKTIRAITVVRHALLVLGLPALLILAWWVFSSGSANIFFPPLSVILRAFAKIWFSAKIVDDVIPSLVRLSIGYLAAVLIGLALGIPDRLVANDPQLLRTGARVPARDPAAGAGADLHAVCRHRRPDEDPGRSSPAASGRSCSTPSRASAGSTKCLGNVVRSYRISSVGRLWHFVLPGASPQIFAGMRQALSIGIILMVISEMFAASNGLGFTLIQFQRGFAIPEMWSGIVLLGLIGFGIALIFRIAEAGCPGLVFRACAAPNERVRNEQPDKTARRWSTSWL